MFAYIIEKRQRQMVVIRGDESPLELRPRVTRELDYLKTKTIGL